MYKDYPIREEKNPEPMIFKQPKDQAIRQQTLPTKFTERGNGDSSSSEDMDSLNDSDMTDFYKNTPLSADGQLR